MREVVVFAFDDAVTAEDNFEVTLLPIDALASDATDTVEFTFEVTLDPKDDLFSDCFVAVPGLT
jgi:hypothetical protein